MAPAPAVGPSPAHVPARETRQAARAARQERSWRALYGQDAASRRRPMTMPFSAPPAAFFLQLRSLVLLPRQRRELVLQLQVAVQPLPGQAALENRSLHRTPRLVPVAAIGEMAP